MFYWNRRKEERAAKERADRLQAQQDEEQLRLGRQLFAQLKLVADANKNLPGNQRIYAVKLEQNAGKYSVVIMFHDGPHRESMLQFNICVKKNELSCGRKYRDGPSFTLSRYDEFVECASKWVRDFR